MSFDRGLEDDAVSIGAAESLSQSSGPQCYESLFGLAEECLRVGALALEGSELGAGVRRAGIERVGQGAPLSEELAEIRLAPIGRVASEVDGELLSSRSAECVGDDVEGVEGVGFEVGAGVLGRVGSVSTDDVEVVPEPSSGEADVAELSVAEEQARSQVRPWALWAVVA